MKKSAFPLLTLVLITVFALSGCNLIFPQLGAPPESRPYSNRDGGDENNANNAGNENSSVNYDDCEHIDRAIDNAYFSGHTVHMTDWTLEDCKAYAEAMQAAGFTIPTTGFDSVVLTDDGSIYSFGASNENGVYVTLGTSVADKAGTISIQINKE